MTGTEHKSSLEDSSQVEEVKLVELKVKDISTHTQPQRPSLREQLDLLSFFVNAGATWAISPVIFPDIPGDRLYAEAVQAHDNNNARIQWARFLIQDPEAVRKLEINATKIIKRSESLLGGITEVEGEIDHRLLRQQMLVRQSGDANKSMDEVINRGLVEDLSERNFPALRGMEPVSRYKLEMDTVKNRIDSLQAHLAMYAKPKPSHIQTIEQDPARSTLSAEIKYWQEMHNLLVEKQAEARKQFKWQVPELN